MATNTTSTDQLARTVECAVRERTLSSIDLSTLYALLPALLEARRLCSGTVIKSHWQVEVHNPEGDSYEIGSCHETLDNAVYFRDKCLEPRRNKRNGIKKNARLRIFRHDTVKVEET